MSEQTASDASESAPGVERTSVLALDELETHDVRRALVLLAGLRSRTLAPLVRSAAVPGGVALTHRVPADAVGLASLRADGPLRAGHVLAVGVAVLEALVALHARAARARRRGRGVGARRARTAAWCSPATGAGVGRGPGGARTGRRLPTTSRRSGELLRDLLGPGSAPAPLVVAVVRAVDPDLALRPDAAALLDALRRCGRPEPLLDALWSPPRRRPWGGRGAAAAAGPGGGSRDAGRRGREAGDGPPRRRDRRRCAHPARPLDRLGADVDPAPAANRPAVAPASAVATVRRRGARGRGRRGRARRLRPRRRRRRADHRSLRPRQPAPLLGSARRPGADADPSVATSAGTAWDVACSPRSTAGAPRRSRPARPSSCAPG